MSEIRRVRAGDEHRPSDLGVHPFEGEDVPAEFALRPDMLQKFRDARARGLGVSFGDSGAPLPEESPDVERTYRYRPEALKALRAARKRGGRR